MHGRFDWTGATVKHHSDLDVARLTRAQAIEVYWERYWRGHRYEFLPEAMPM